MWYHNLLILILYVILFHIFICSVEWYNNVFGLEDIVNPFSLNSKQLRLLLNVRGIFDAGIVDKQDLIQLADASGPIRFDEIKDLKAENIEQKEKPTADVSRNVADSTNLVEEFIGSQHFFEQVEDSKSNIWLIKVVAENSRTEIKPAVWSNLIRKFDRFEVRFGTWYCSLEPELCNDRKWNTSRFLLATPGSLVADRSPQKSKMMLHQYTGPYTENSLTQWIYTTSGQRSNMVKMLNTPHELSQWILNQCSLFDQVCLLLVSTLTLPPFFLGALGVKFNGRIKIGFCSPNTLNESSESRSILSVNDQRNHTDLVESSDVDSTKREAPRGRNLAARQGSSTSSSSGRGRYFVVSRRRSVQYGNEADQLLTYQRLEGYLKWLAPDMNDVFVFTLFVTNALALVSIFDLARASPLQRTIHLFCTLIKYNAILLTVWICIASVANWRLFASSCQRMAYVLRYNVMSHRNLRRFVLSTGVRSFGDHITRSYWSKIHLTAFLLFNCVIYCLRRRFWPNSLRPQYDSLWSQWSTLYGSAGMAGRRRASGVWGDAAATTPAFRGMGFFSFWNPRSTLLDTDSYFPTESNMVLHPNLIRLIENCGIENVRAYPSIPYDYILRLEMIHYRSMPIRKNLQKKLRSSDGNHLCSRCRIASLMQMKHVLDRLRLQPCSKCDFSPERLERKASSPLVFPTSTHFNCPICLDGYKNGEILCKLPCSHSYHQRCILAWLLRDQPTCPFCRYPAYLSPETDYIIDKLA